jgi:hypothetical protein
VSTSDLLADRLAVGDVLNRLAWSQDRRDWDRVADLLADRLDVGYGPADQAGTTEVSRADLMRTWRDGLDGTTSQHVLTGIVVSVEGDIADATFNELVWVVRPAGTGSSMYHFGAAMQYRLHRADPWRIIALRMNRIWSEGDSAVLGNRSTPFSRLPK